MSIAAIGRINTPARSRAPAATASIHQSTRPPILHQLDRALSLSVPGSTPSAPPAAVGGGLITPYVIYLLSHPIARIGSNPSTFAVPIDPYRTRGGIEIPGDAAHQPPPHQHTRRSRSIPSICTTIPQPQAFSLQHYIINGIKTR